MSDVQRPKSLAVSKETMDSINRKGLKRPKDATMKGMGDESDTTYTWTEYLKVVGADVQYAKDNSDVLVFSVKVRIPDDSPYPTNIGEQDVIYLRVNEKAVNDPKHDEHQRTGWSLRDLTSLIRACGFVIERGDVDFVPFFLTPSGGQFPPLVGANIFARIIDKPGKDKSTGDDTRYQNYSKFLSKDAGK